MSSAVPLTQAVTSGDRNAVSAALAKGADVNERNNGGQTALILAVIFGHTDLVRLLVKAGADPRLRDNLGLDAIEWAQRRGLAIDLFNRDEPPAQPIREIRVTEEPQKETQTDTDEKSRKWLEGLKQRIQEQSLREQPVVKPEPEPAPAPAAEPKPAPPPAPAPPPEPEPVPEPVTAESKTSATRKRCPKCNAIYDSELLAYCAHHVVPLVDIDEPVYEPPLSTTAALTNTITNTPLLWTLILVTVSIAAFTGYMITNQLSQIVLPDTPAAQQQPQSFLKGTPVAAGDLAGKAVTLAEAECPVFEGDSRSNANGASHTVNVHLKVDKAGKVFWARAEGGDEAMRTAATEAATKSTFSPDRLRGRETAGIVTYTFEPEP